MDKLICLKTCLSTRHCQVLVCTDVAGMGVDIKGLNLSVIIGKYFNIISHPGGRY